MRIRVPSMRVILPFLLAPVLLAGAAPVEEPVFPAGTSSQTLEGLRCSIVMPEGFDPAKEHSLLVILHGAGGTETGMAGSLADLAARDFVVLAPKSSAQTWSKRIFSIRAAITCDMTATSLRPSFSIWLGNIREFPPSVEVAPGEAIRASGKQKSIRTLTSPDTPEPSPPKPSKNLRKRAVSATGGTGPGLAKPSGRHSSMCTSVHSFVGARKTTRNVMISRSVGIRAMKRGLLAVFLIFTVSSATQAGPLGVPVDPYPTIIAGFISSGYNATTGGFVANGWALTLDQGAGKQNITTNFRLTATIENSGLATNGTLTVGSVASPLLLSNALLRFGFNAVSGGSLEFLFGSVVGSYVPGVYSATMPIDVAITGLGTGFPGTFGTSWTSSSNTAELREDPPPAVPEPSTLLLMLAGAGGLCRQVRKRKQAPASDLSFV